MDSERDTSSLLSEDIKFRAFCETMLATFIKQAASINILIALTDKNSEILLFLWADLAGRNECA